MYIYNNNDKKIIINRVFNFKKQTNNFFSGKINENEYKFCRLQNGYYRQRNSYMYRIAIPYGFLNLVQLYFISYIALKYDKKYVHLTTRTNIQFNWIKIIFFLEILEKISTVDLHSIQTSGNCVRNITSSFYKSKEINIFSWSEIIRQWFTKNFEFLYLPRKFKIATLAFKLDSVFLKIHDLGIYIKKNTLNKLVINILIGGGLGRTPIMGVYMYKNIHWKNIINYCEKILRVYNLYGFRENLYKARIKVLLKSINIFKFKFLINDEVFKNKTLILNEKEVNNYFFLFDLNKNKKVLSGFLKKIKFNNFFLNWIKINIKKIKKDSYLFIPIKNLDFSPGDIISIQLKVMSYFYSKFNYDYLIINNRQNLTLINNNYYYFYNFYIFLKKIYNTIFNNFINDIVCCPGYDYCSLANTKSINLSNYLKKIYYSYNTCLNLNEIYINISGCINSCAHHHISNIGFLGVNKNNDDFYQIYLGGSTFLNENIKFSKILGRSVNEFNAISSLNNIINFFLQEKFNFENFIDFYNRKEHIDFKSLLYIV